MLLEEKLSISSLLDLSEKKLAIPYEYQRLYVWHEKSVRQLFYDTYNAFKNNLTEYRLGTIILHHKNENIYDIVNGQQMLVILYLLLYALYKNSSYKLYIAYFFTYFYLFIKLFCQL